MKRDGTLDERDRELAPLQWVWERESNVNGTLCALNLCFQRGWPLPEWVARAAMEGLRLHARKGGQGKRSPAEKHAALARHQRLHTLVRVARFNGMTLEQSFAAVAERERETFESVRNSYRLIQRRRGVLNPPD